MSKGKLQGIYAPVLFMILTVIIPVVVFASSGADTHGSSSGAQWKELLLKTMNFSVMVFILYKLLSKPAKKFFAGRREDIKRSFDGLKAEKSELEAKYEEYKNRLASLDKEAEKIIQEFVAQGEKEKEKIIEEGRRAAAIIREQAESTIQLEIALAKSELMKEISEMSVNMAEDLMRKNITSGDQKALVDEFLMKVVEAK